MPAATRTAILAAVGARRSTWRTASQVARLAKLPRRIESTGMAEDLLAAVVGEVEQVRIPRRGPAGWDLRGGPRCSARADRDPWSQDDRQICGWAQPTQRIPDSDRAALARSPIPEGSGMRPTLIDSNQSASHRSRNQP
jgi:hypothetical protein